MSKPSLTSPDLSEIVVTEIIGANKELKFKTPLVLIPTISDGFPPLFLIDAPQVGLRLFACTRTELIDDINEELFILWDEYIDADPEILAPGALRLREYLLANLEA